MGDETFENATVHKAALVYYDGRVTSRELQTADGSRKTLGVILPGEYAFETAEEETIEILDGVLRVDHPDGSTGRYEPGDVFSIPPESEFVVATDDVVDYCCSYG